MAFLGNSNYQKYLNYRTPSKRPVDDIDIEGLYSKIGRLEMENDFLKKKSGELSSCSVADGGA
jgi:hypothetical protein